MRPATGYGLQAMGEPQHALPESPKSGARSRFLPTLFSPGGPHLKMRPAATQVNSCSRAQSVGGETVEQPGAARLHERGLAAAGAHVCGIPGRVAAPEPVVMAEDRPVAIGIARPVVAREHGCRPDLDPALRVGAGQHVVLVGLVADAFHLLALLGERGRLADVVAVTLDVAVQVGNVARDQLT